MNKLKRIIIGLIILAGIAGVGWYFYGRTEESKPLPTFSFDSTKAAGWTGSENVNVQTVARSTTYKGEEPIENLPIADITVHHGTKTDIPDDNCFVMYSYFNHQLDDPSAAYEEYASRKSKDGKVETFDPISQTIQTFEGGKNYWLRQYRYEIDNKDALQGYQIGFVPLTAGYIRVETVCKTYEDLTQALPALQSVQLLGN